MPTRWRDEAGEIAAGIRPILVVGERHGCRHLSVFGSAVTKPLAQVGDIDVHVVVEHMTRAALAELAAAGALGAARLAEELGSRPVMVELHHGPLQPPPARPGEATPLQLHLILDDRETVGRTPWVVLLQREASGILVAGEGLLSRASGHAGPERPGGHDRLLREAYIELRRWGRALRTGTIPVRHWVDGDPPRLLSGWVEAATPWRRWCLLRAAARSADLHCRLVWLAALGLDGALTHPVMSGRDAELTPEDLARSWALTSRRVADSIEQRMAAVARLLSTGRRSL